MRLRVLLTLVVLALVASAILRMSPDTPGAPAVRPTLELHVDARGVGGSCSDARPVRAVTSAARPWCTLEKALRAAPAGSTVLVRRGRYPSLEFAGTPKRQDDVTVRPFAEEPVTIDGIRLTESSHLRFAGFTFSAPVIIGPRSHHVQLLGNVVYDPSVNTAGVNILNGSHDILVSRNFIQTLRGTAINFSSGAASNPDPISDVTLQANHIDGVGVDAMQLKNFANVRVEGNEIEHVERFDGGVHPDILQTLYGGRNLVIDGNRVHDSAAGFLITDGIDGVLMRNNVITRLVDHWAVMIGNASDVRLVANTIVGNELGVILRRNVHQAVVTDNVLGSLKVTEGANIAVENKNNIATRGGRQRAAAQQAIPSLPSDPEPQQPPRPQPADDVLGSGVDTPGK
jgi:hypothetical protein